MDQGSVGQNSANDDNANEKYPTLDGEIERTYVARSTATSKRTLYDSYIRAIKWATLRLGDRGIVAFVTNGGFLDSNAADGMRQALAEEFAAIHVFNLRGNRRQGGAEGRPIWEAFAKGLWRVDRNHRHRCAGQATAGHGAGDDLLFTGR